MKEDAVRLRGPHAGPAGGTLRFLAQPCYHAVLRAAEVRREGVRKEEAAGEAYTTDLVKAMAAWQTHAAAEGSSGGVLERQM